LNSLIARKDPKLFQHKFWVIIVHVGRDLFQCCNLVDKASEAQFLIDQLQTVENSQLRERRERSGEFGFKTIYPN
jgi:hypothetical protein